MKTSAIVQRFRQSAAKFPDRYALANAETEISYRALERKVAYCARQISENVKTDVMAMLMPNGFAFPELLLGALWAGKSIAVLPTLAPPPLLKMMMMEVGADKVVTNEEFVPRLMEAGVPCWIGETSGELDPNDVPQQEMAREGAIMLYTSGTTGRPKTVELTEENILANIDGCAEAEGFTEKEVMMAILPLFHAYGLTITILLPLTYGARCVIVERFIPRLVLQLIEKFKVSCFIAVPNQYRLLTKEPTEVDASSLWLCIAGGERLPDQVAIEFEERFHRTIVQGYGATEVSPVISVNRPDANIMGSVGQALPNIKVTIRDDQGALLPTGETGEVCVEGPTVMLGYFNDKEATARKIVSGVLRTGDKGYLDKNGYIFLAGRADDLVKVSGEKVYPAEVERALESVPGVDEAAVIAFPDEKHGSRLHAFVQLKPNTKLTGDDVRSSVRQMLEPYKVPRGVTFVDALPRTVTGKTDKRSLATAAV
jgi:long-chain acyl-CoA synthetase